MELDEARALIQHQVTVVRGGARWSGYVTGVIPGPSIRIDQEDGHVVCVALDGARLSESCPLHETSSETCVACGDGRAVELRAVTAGPGVDDWFHTDDGSHCAHRSEVAVLTPEVAATAATLLDLSKRSLPPHISEAQQAEAYLALRRIAEGQ